MVMATRVVVPSTLLRSFQRFAVRDSDADAYSDDSGSSAHHGLVLGVANALVGDENAVAIWGVVRDFAERDTVLPYIVRGVDAVGSFTVWVRDAGHRDVDETAERNAAAEIAQQALAAVASVSPQVALIYVHETKRVHAFAKNGDAAALEIIDCAHASDFLSATDSLLLRASLTFSAESVHEIAKWRAELENTVSKNVFFQFPEQRNHVFAAHGQRVDVSATNKTVEALSALVKIPEKRQAASTTSKTKKKKATASDDNWDVATTKTTSTSRDILSSVNSDGETTSGYLKTLEYGEIAGIHVLQSLGFSASMVAKGSPALTLHVSSTRSSRVQIQADALVIVAQSASVADVVSSLRGELIKQLARLEALWSPTASSLQSHHFALVGAAFPLTLSTKDQAHASPSLTLATQLLQPSTQPLLAPASCSLVENAAALASMDVLFNVHEGVPPSGVPNGTQYLVDGYYGYYHYLQQSMNDKGWGCAYRSLQTLASWLYWNHYTHTKTLTHTEIQETLVAIGDKPAAFIGSREWIGSMEVGFVLDERFGISFRTLNVANGAQLVEKAQELKHHFETQGTPVMMGGGQLAFTLLGIDYNASTGECAFLILDPHYVGAEDLETIQTKTMALEGYKAVPCGWRKASSFSKTSFYNLCLPQRPELGAE